MAKSALPVIPRIIFGVIEPAMLIWAYKDCQTNPTAFFAAQAPPFTLPADDAAVPAQALVPLLQLANVYLLLAALAVLCSWTSDAAIARRYLFAVALADIGHVHACYRGLGGGDAFWDVGGWNAMLWGSVVGSAVLNLCRWATLLGGFGEVRGPRGPGGPRKSA